MKKIPTLFKKDPNNLGRVINEINPGNEWALTDSYATRKFDGTACAIINNILYKRYDVKKGRSIPNGAIPCQDPDEITGHWPHWVKCDRDDKSDQYHFEAFDRLSANKVESTYELVGPKIQGNPEGYHSHCLVPHGFDCINLIDLSFDSIRSYLSLVDIEGIVFYATDKSMRMCKIRKKDFGLKRHPVIIPEISISKYIGISDTPNTSDQLQDILSQYIAYQTDKLVVYTLPGTVKIDISKSIRLFKEQDIFSREIGKAHV